MNLSNEVSIPILLSAAAGIGTWVRSVETRFATHDALMNKIDQLVTLMLEEKISGSNQDRSGASKSMDSRSNQPDPRSGYGHHNSRDRR